MKTTNKALLAAYKRAEEFAYNPKLLASYEAVSLDTKLQKKALKDPRSYLQSRGVKIPDGLDVKFIPKALPIRPVPDYEFFTIRLYNCRTFWLKERKGQGFEKVEICFGIEIVPNPIPGGPIG